MEYKLDRVSSIGTRADETVRFPVVGLLDADYLIRDQNEQEAGKARVDQSVITVFAIQSDLDRRDQIRIRDLLIRAIVTDADSVNANLSIEISPASFDLMELKRFLERFGFRATSHTNTNAIMKRNAGSSHPPIMAETTI